MGICEVFQPIACVCHVTNLMMSPRLYSAHICYEQVIITVPDLNLPFLSPYCCYQKPSMIQEAPIMSFIFNMPKLLLDVPWPGALTRMALEFRVGPQQPSFWRQTNGDRLASEI